MLFWYSPPCKNRALDRALWCFPPSKNRALARAFWCGFRENCSTSCRKSWSGPCFFGVPLRAKNRALDRALWRSPPCKNRAPCFLVFSSVQKSCSSLWKLLQTMDQTHGMCMFLAGWNETALRSHTAVVSPRAPFAPSHKRTKTSHAVRLQWNENFYSNS